jgi:hypothetical protein
MGQDRNGKEVGGGRWRRGPLSLAATWDIIWEGNKLADVSIGFWIHSQLLKIGTRDENWSKWTWKGYLLSWEGKKHRQREFRPAPGFEPTHNCLVLGWEMRFKASRLVRANVAETATHNRHQELWKGRNISRFREKEITEKLRSRVLTFTQPAYQAPEHFWVVPDAAFARGDIHRGSLPGVHELIPEIVGGDLGAAKSWLTRDMGQHTFFDSYQSDTWREVLPLSVGPFQVQSNFDRRDSL